MVKIILIIIPLAFFLFVLWNLIKNYIACSYLKKEFSKCNVIVAGKKGSGKDMIFNKVINIRKKAYYANIPYNEKLEYLPIKIRAISVAPNTFQDLINETISFIPKVLKECTDIYISDGGNYLPSQYDSLLSKLYPSFPIFYSLSRHLYNCNVHCNTQNLGRLWIKLREQGDCYLQVKYTRSYFGCLFKTFFVGYDKYESANLNLLPFCNSFLKGKEYKALKEQYSATNGFIKVFYIWQFKRNLNYDTRYFHTVFFGFKAPKFLKRKKVKGENF